MPVHLDLDFMRMSDEEYAMWREKDPNHPKWAQEDLRRKNWRRYRYQPITTAATITLNTTQFAAAMRNVAAASEQMRLSYHRAIGAMR